METERVCFLCGRNGCGDPLDRHHIFGGGLRKKSEKYGLVVDLCHSRCHEHGPKSAHQNREVSEELKKWGQRKAMLDQGWSLEEFIIEFGKNHLTDEELEEMEAI